MWRVSMIFSCLRRAFREFFWALRRPRSVLKADLNSDFWHEHICVPFRLDKGLFMEVCPGARCRRFEPEHEFRCDNCRYLSVIMANKGGTGLELHGYPSFLKEEETWVEREKDYPFFCV